MKCDNTTPAFRNMSGVPISCGCVNENNTKRALAMAYVEWQKWQNVYPAEVGFARGTLFEDLDLPFIGEEVACDV